MKAAQEARKRARAQVVIQKLECDARRLTAHESSCKNIALTAHRTTRQVTPELKEVKLGDTL